MSQFLTLFVVVVRKYGEFVGKEKLVRVVLVEDERHADVVLHLEVPDLLDLELVRCCLSFVDDDLVDLDLLSDQLTANTDAELQLVLGDRDVEDLAFSIVFVAG